MSCFCFEWDGGFQPAPPGCLGTSSRGGSGIQTRLHQAEGQAASHWATQSRPWKGFNLCLARHEVEPDIAPDAFRTHSCRRRNIPQAGGGGAEPPAAELTDSPSRLRCWAVKGCRVLGLYFSISLSDKVGTFTPCLYTLWISGKKSNFGLFAVF